MPSTTPTIAAITWHPYLHYYSSEYHSVVGNVVIGPNVYSPQLDNRRHVIVYLPPSYAGSQRHYPVIYMQDGQNLFDHVTAFVDDWKVDETMETLATQGYEAIIVGIYNGGEQRNDEYSPYSSEHFHGGRGDAYLDFVIDTLKPAIDRDFRTLPDRHNTSIMGSSLGGLISLYAFLTRRETFGQVGLMSPSLWFGDGKIFDLVEKAPKIPGKIYLDAGTREYADFIDRPLMRSRYFYRDVRRLYRMLHRQGYRPMREVLYVEEQWARHREAAWARRLPAALHFLIPKQI
jgi:predicted alpha/beta superfamily hydrolase